MEMMTAFVLMKASKKSLSVGNLSVLEDRMILVAVPRRARPAISSWPVTEFHTVNREYF